MSNVPEWLLLSIGKCKSCCGYINTRGLSGHHGHRCLITDCSHLELNRHTLHKPPLIHRLSVYCLNLPRLFIWHYLKFCLVSFLLDAWHSACFYYNLPSQFRNVCQCVFNKLLKLYLHPSSATSVTAVMFIGHI